MASEATADRITSAALRIFEKDGAEAVSMRRVASAVGITPMAIYRHFEDREALLNAIADGGFEDLAARFKGPQGKSSIEHIENLTSGYLDFALTRPRLFEYMFSSRRKGARQFPKDFVAEKSPTANLLAMFVKEAMNSGELRKDDVWEVTMTISAEAHGLITLYMGGRFQLDEKNFKALFRRSIRRLVHGLATGV
jgi:AcrR family transcriptional regulator